MGELLTVFGIDWKMLVVETINFLVLLGGLSYFLYRPVMKMLRERAEKIAEGLKDAQAAKEAAADIESKRASVLAAAEHDAEGLLSRAVAEGKDERAKIVKTAQERSDTMLEDARAEAAELQRRALAESEKDVTRLAVLAAEKILRKQS
ncbi:MAG: F0F1 ATP synthase subunit B [Patescibacteria group bacterium]